MASGLGKPLVDAFRSNPMARPASGHAQPKRLPGWLPSDLPPEGLVPWQDSAGPAFPPKKVNLATTTCFQRLLRPFRHLGRLVSKKWGIQMRYYVSIAALAATLVAATPAMAASSATATANARGIVLKSLSLTSSADLDFGTVAADATLPGTVTVNSDTGARTTTGAVVALPGAFGRAQFDGLGDPSASVQLTLTQPAGGVICTGGPACPASIPAAISLDNGGANRTTDTNGRFTVFVGGDFDIAANQQNGTYSSQFDLTAVYP